MNILRKGIKLLSMGIKSQYNEVKVPVLNNVSTNIIQTMNTSPLSLLARTMASLAQMHRTGPHIKQRKSRNPLNGNPFAKGVVLKTLIKKPKKPNSANRKCVLVRLSNGKEMIAYVPGIGHNLQEHNIVLVRVGRLKDCPGVKLKCVRGKYDLSHVVKQNA
ncbi:40S ribosomal protein S12, mitochondrial [Galleria mellonella]|uniref:Small ribosomal subunit protein uS12m n=1 Tax=Galleria mellonella TaxID=7137 RepID=A0ABM3MHB9_GALME|nr:40S ribosomal protein S12, mitochondrial [Galleria mellonella]